MSSTAIICNIKDDSLSPSLKSQSSLREKDRQMMYYLMCRHQISQQMAVICNVWRHCVLLISSRADINPCEECVCGIKNISFTVLNTKTY